ncbi:MAG: prolipoprotein diacylglyceryl transferase family protein [Bacteroidia bacterium]
MFPRLSDLIFYLFGINIPLPIAMFGFMVGLAFLAGHYFFTWEMQRKEAQGIFSPQLKTITTNYDFNYSDLLWNAVFGFFMGFKLLPAITNYKAFVANPPEFILSGSGNFTAGLIGIALMAAYQYYEYNKTKNKPSQTVQVTVLAHSYVLNMIFIGAFTGLIGAKIFHNLENINEFMANPMEALISFSGLTMYGGLIVASVCVLYYAHKNGLRMLDVADACAPTLMIGYAIGRMGCQLSGDGDWGVVNTLAKPFSTLPDWLWSFKYPHNVVSEGIPIPGCEGQYCYELAQGVFPTPVYESIMCFALFGLLWLLRKRINAPGVMFSLYLLLNGVERLGIESIRVNTQYNIMGGITQAQIIATLLIIIGGIGIVYFKQKNKTTPLIKTN